MKTDQILHTITKNVILLNHRQKQCGVYQYGYRVGNILKKSTKYNFIYCEAESKSEFMELALMHQPAVILYNYHPLTMAWLGNDTISELSGAVHYGFHHEGSKPDNIGFNGYMIVDSTVSDTETDFSVPRPLFENVDMSLTERISNEVPVIGSFGFGFGNKGFGRLVKMVNDEFDEAIIKLHIPFAYYGDREGMSVEKIHPGCWNEVKKSGIKLEITTEFLSDKQLLQFLASNTINAFLYDEMLGRGLSSVIDYALSVPVPIAISGLMFRHIYNATPSICVENRTIRQIIESGASPLDEFRKKWSNAALIQKLETIVDNAIQ